jgi:hypothetical protein
MAITALLITSDSAPFAPHALAIASGNRVWHMADDVAYAVATLTGPQLLNMTWRMTWRVTWHHRLSLRARLLSHATGFDMWWMTWWTTWMSWTAWMMTWQRTWHRRLTLPAPHHPAIVTRRPIAHHRSTHRSAWQILLATSKNAMEVNNRRSHIFWTTWRAIFASKNDK